jgi:hypothetical protein
MLRHHDAPTLLSRLVLGMVAAYINLVLANSTFVLMIPTKHDGMFERSWWSPVEVRTFAKVHIHVTTPYVPFST